MQKRTEAKKRKSSTARPPSEPVYKEVFVKGLVLGPGHVRPVLIMKGESEEEVFPVWLSNMEFDSYEQSNTGTLKSTYFHHTSVKLFKSLGLKVERCLFSELVGHHQYVDIHIKNERLELVKVVRSNAEESISFCLAAGARFFATEEIMEKSRVMNTEILAASFEVPSHSYVM